LHLLFAVVDEKERSELGLHGMTRYVQILQYVTVVYLLQYI